MSASVGLTIPNIWKNKIHVPNHQPVQKPEALGNFVLFAVIIAAVLALWPFFHRGFIMINQWSLGYPNVPNNP